MFSSGVVFMTYIYINFFMALELRVAYVSAEANKDMSTTLAAINGNINLDCNFKSAGDDGIVVWKWGISRKIRHNSEEGLKKTEGAVVSTINNEGTYAAIQIMNLSLQDAGPVTCSRYFTKAGYPETCNWMVYFQDGPNITELSAVQENESISARCCVQFNELSGSATFVWSIGDTVLVKGHDTNKTSIDVDNATTCESVSLTANRVHHGKQLTCLIQNSLNYSVSSQIQVTYPVNVWWGPAPKPHNVLVTNLEGFINITCMTDGFPPVTAAYIEILNVSDRREAMWEISLNGNLVKRDGATQTWSFPYQIEKRDDNIVRCRTSNGTYPSVSTEHVKVELGYPLSVRMISALKTELNKGDHFVISCVVDGNPAPDTYIEKEDSYGSWEVKPISLTNKQSRNRTKEIVWNFNISITEGDEKGKYRCFANNSQEDSVSEDVLVLNIKKTVIQLLMDNYILVIVSAVIVTLVLLFVIREISLHRRLNGINFRSAIRSRSYRRSSSKSQVNSNADALPVNDKELPSPHIMEHMVTFKRKLKKGKTRQRWLGILKSDLGCENDIHISTGTNEAMDEWSYFVKSVGQISEHDSIVTLIGFTTKLSATYCLQEHLSGGNVRTFLEMQYGHYYLHGNIDALVPSAFFRFALNITSGVNFLHSHGWVCPGITAGKVLIDQARTSCKLYDFCPLSYTGRKVENELRKNRPIPFINLPPEVFQDKVYNRYSDIWAVGVVLWEIFSYGAWPPTHENVKDRQDVLLKLTRPGNCSEDVYHALANCWLFDQSSRKSLQVLEECLESNKTDSSLSARAMNIEDIYTVELPPYSGFAKVENSSDI